MMTQTLINYWHNKENQVILKLYNTESAQVSFKKIDYHNYFFVNINDKDRVKYILENINVISENKFGNITKRIELKVELQLENIYCKVLYSDINNNMIFNVIREIEKELNLNNIQHFELDLLNGDNYILDNNYKISDDYRVLYFDLETDDRQGSVEIGRDRILSVCAIDNTGKEFTFCNDSEIQILEQFKDLLENYDIIIGWNSTKFDSPYLKARMQKNNIFHSFKSLIEIDLMTVFMSSFYAKIRQGKEYITSYSLDNIARTFIKDAKLEIKELDIGFGGRIYNLFVNDRQSLLDYNLHDCKLLKRIDEEFNLIKNE
ncbi:MAG: 3'-5' exonuclease, partial [Nanoarchaeota archaeon]